MVRRGFAAAAARLLPPPGPHRTLSAVTLMGALGAGAFATSSAVFFTRSVGLSVAQVGVGMTAAGAVGLVGSVLSGKVADRIGARETLIGLACLQGVLFLGYLAVGSFPAFLLAICAMTVAERSGGVVRSTVIAVVVERGERVRLRRTCGRSSTPASRSVRPPPPSRCTWTPAPATREWCWPTRRRPSAAAH
jgi:predicted MFS family arabinose efflux permease